MTRKKYKQNGKGIVTDIGSVLFPVLGSVGGTLGGTTLGAVAGPVGGAVGGALGSAFGEEGGKGLNEWLKTLGLGQGRSLRGNGFASDLLNKAKSEVGSKVYKELVKGLHSGFKTAQEGDKMGWSNLAQKWLNLFRMGGKGYATQPLQLGSGSQYYTYGSNGIYQQIPMPSKSIKGMGSMGSGVYNMISNDFGKIYA